MQTKMFAFIYSDFSLVTDEQVSVCVQPRSHMVEPCPSVCLSLTHCLLETRFLS